MALQKPWQPYDEATAREIPGTVGVFEVGDADGNALYIGMAGGRSRFGLRSGIMACFSLDCPNAALRGHARFYRYEVNQMYMSRYVELLERHLHAAGDLPPGNQEPGEYVPTLGRAGQRAVAPPRGEQGG